MALKVEIDYTRCVSTGACMVAAPEVFVVKEDGTWVLQETPGEELREKVLDAMRGCPTHAVIVEENGLQLT